MTTDPDLSGSVEQVIENFVEHVSAQVHNRWAVWAMGHEQRLVHEVVGGLLARQATLATELALSPYVWNHHSAPLFLRAMVENCITIAWILLSPDERSKQFVAYGLGQEVLLLEQAKAGLGQDEVDPERESMIEAWEHWLNSQRFTFLTEVNVGNWGPTLRQMAEEAGLLELHRNDYARWSSTTHNMWHHVVRFNLQECTNPLHGRHRIASIPRQQPEPEFLLRAAEYVDIAIRSFDEATDTSVDEIGAVEVLERELQSFRASTQMELNNEQS